MSVPSQLLPPYVTFATKTSSKSFPRGQLKKKNNSLVKREASLIVQFVPVTGDYQKCGYYVTHLSAKWDGSLRYLRQKFSYFLDYPSAKATPLHQWMHRQGFCLLCSVTQNTKLIFESLHTNLPRVSHGEVEKS